MNFIKRGWLSLTRRKGKAIILFTVIFILGNVMAGAVSIRQASSNVEKVIKHQLGSKATIDLDFKKVEKEFQKDDKYRVKGLDTELINKIGNSEYVKYYDYNLSVMMGKGDLKPFVSEKEGNAVMSSVAGGGSGGSDFTLKGVQYNEVLDFNEKKAQLIDGRVFTNDEIEKGNKVTIISKKVADENNLKVGDKIVLPNEIYDYSSGYSENSEPSTSRDLVLEVIGIFEPTNVEPKEGEKDEDGNMQMDFFNTMYQNTMYVPNLVAKGETDFQNTEFSKLLPEEMKGNQDEMYSPVYILKNPEMSDSFKNEIEKLIPSPYKLNSSTDEYDSIAAPIKSMEKLSTYVLIAAIGASLLIVSLVVLLFLRDRKHEFGVYLSLGEKRARVIGQIIFEVITIAILALGLSVSSGNMLASSLSNSMVQSQIEAQMEKESNEMGTMFLSDPGEKTKVTEEDVSEAYKVNLTPSYLITFFSLGIGTILGATIVPMGYLMRLNPKKIML